MGKFIKIEYTKEAVGINYNKKDYEVLDPLVNDLEKIQNKLKSLKDSQSGFMEMGESKDLLLMFIPNFPLDELRTGEIAPIFVGIKKALLSRSKKG